MIGTYGNREANWAVQNCDLLIVLGARLDVRQTGSDTKDFARCAKIVQIDIDPSQLDNRVDVDMKICASINTFFEQFKIDNSMFSGIDPMWIKELKNRRLTYDRDEYLHPTLTPYRLFNSLNRIMADRAVEYVCDIGNHQMWAANLLRLGKNQIIHFSGGMGAMGFGLPTAIGIALRSGIKTITITGDGSVQVNIHEFDTLKRLNLDLTIIVLNNRSLGMVKNYQDMYFDGLDQSTKKGYSCPSFYHVAKAYGIDAILVCDAEDMELALQKMINRSGPLLIEIDMDGAVECRPRLTFGHKLEDQEPKLD
jgi:acetolactate synthase I/II/III large subunit